MFLSWSKYREFLSRGREAPASAVQLNNLVRDGFPKISLSELDGRDVRLENYLGKVVILNFWASWCDPCVAEFPSLVKLIDRFKGEVHLIAVSADYERKDIESFLKMFKANLPAIHVVWDRDLKLANQLGTNKLPESYIIGKDGHLVRKVAGVDDWSNASAIEFFESLVKK